MLIVCRVEPQRLQKVRLHSAAVHTPSQETNMLMLASQRKHSCDSQHTQTLTCCCMRCRSSASCNTAHPSTQRLTCCGLRIRGRASCSPLPAGCGRSLWGGHRLLGNIDLHGCRQVAGLCRHLWGEAVPASGHAMSRQGRLHSACGMIAARHDKTGVQAAYADTKQLQRLVVHILKFAARQRNC